MTTIIVSDTHLTDRFNKRKLDYLKRIFSEADKIILNGDFWDGHMIDFDDFIKSCWNKLFPILKAKKTIYIFGNHDHKDRQDHRVYLFSDKQVEMLLLANGKKKIWIEHGNRITPALNEKFPWLPSIKLIFSILQFLNLLAVKIFGKKFYLIYIRRNRKMKAWCREKLPSNHFLICGHSHVAELNPAYRFANTGFVRYGYGHYIKIVNTNLELVEERY